MVHYNVSMFNKVVYFSPSYKMTKNINKVIFFFQTRGVPASPDSILNCHI